MMNKVIEAKLIELKWVFSHVCAKCGGNKRVYKREGETLTAYPSRDFYSFTENGKTKTGKLSQL